MKQKVGMNPITLIRAPCKANWLWKFWSGKLTRSLQTSASFLHPENIHVIRAALGPKVDQVEIAGLLERRTRALIAPLLDFRMTVSEGEAARAVVIAGRNVHELPRS